MLMGRFSERFCFTHRSGDALYPVKITSSESGATTFQVYSKGNLARDRLEVMEAELEHYVFDLNYGVRMECPSNPDRNGIYKRDGREIVVVRHPCNSS